MHDTSASRPSKKQKELLSFIDTFIAGHGYGPSYREIMRALDYKSVSTVAVHVDNLIVKGHVRKRDHSARSLEVVTQVARAPSTEHVTKTEEKWLIDRVEARFSDYEREPTEKNATICLFWLAHCTFSDSTRQSRRINHGCPKTSSKLAGTSVYICRKTR